MKMWPNHTVQNMVSADRMVTKNVPKCHQEENSQTTKEANRPVTL